MRYLKQSTAVTVTVGPMIDEVDFITPITSVTHAGIVAGLIKGTTNGAITVTASAGVNDLVHILAGHHSLELTTGNTDTVGHLRIHLSDADSFLPVWEDFMVVEEQVFDSLHGAGDLLDVQVGGMDANVITATAINANAITAAKIATDAITAAKIATDAITSDKIATTAVNEIRDSILSDSTPFNGVDVGAGPLRLQNTTITGLSSQTVFNLSAGSADDDAYNGCLIVSTDSATSTQKSVTYVLDYVGSTKTVTLNVAPVFTIANGDTVDIFADRSLKPITDNRHAVIAVGGQVAIDADLGIGKWGTANFDNDFLTAALIANGAIDAATFAADAIDAAALATDAVNEIRDSILSDATKFAGANINATISSRATPANVNTEVLDVLQTDTFSQPGQEAPAATQSFLKMIQFLYKAWRNKTDQTATDIQLYNDDASTVDQQTTVSDDATTFVRNEMASGP